MSVLPICRIIRIHYPSIYPAIHNRSMLMGRVVRRGDLLENGGVVGFCVPDPCIIWSCSDIKYAKLVKYKVEKLSKNYKVILNYGDSSDIYIYPSRIWEITQSLMDSFISGKLKQQGAIFYGPPGVGKTSMARLISEILGLTTFDFHPSLVLSKYVGETEKNVRKLFTQAEQCEPSLILMDDAEWALMSRTLLMSSVSGGSTELYVGLISELLSWIEKWFRESRRVFVIATTNVGKDKLDPAFQRGGRLGKPIYIPLPDVEAVEELLKELGVPGSMTKIWSIRIVNYGLSMSDAVNIAKDLISGREPIIDPQHGIGYRRYVLQRDLGKYGLKLLKTIASIYELNSSIERRKRWSYWIQIHEPVSIPLANTLFGMYLKQPVLTMVDFRNIDEVIDASTSVDGCILVPTDSMPMDIITLMHMKADKVIFCGKTQPRFSVPIVNLPTSMISDVELKYGLAEVIASFYGIELTQEDLGIIKNIDIDSLIKTLETLAFHGSKLSEAYKVSGI